MKVAINEKKYILDLTSLITLYKRFYEVARTTGIQLPDGKIFIMNNQSLIRTALKMIISPIVLPVLRAMYAERGLELEPPKRHADLIDYTVYAFFELAQVSQQELNVAFQADEVSENGSTRLSSVTASWEDRDRSTERHPTLITSGSNTDRRETWDNIRENRHGQNTLEEGMDTASIENTSTLE